MTAPLANCRVVLVRPLMHAVRHLIGRARPTEMEVKLLHGLSREMLWAIRESQSPRN